MLNSKDPRVNCWECNSCVIQSHTCPRPPFSSAWHETNREQHRRASPLPTWLHRPIAASILLPVRVQAYNSTHSGHKAKNGRFRAAVSRQKVQSSRRWPPTKSKRPRTGTNVLLRTNAGADCNCRSRIVPALQNSDPPTLHRKT